MKIISRPEDMPVGQGDFLVKMTLEQLQYIGAMLYNTRLGDGTYKDAAFELVGVMDDLFGDSFIQEASEAVDFSITIEDNRGNPVAEYHNSDICIEV